eukprot:SAG31_NODE_43015_length_269_cov_0.600000_2_plen_38_part_01
MPSHFRDWENLFVQLECGRRLALSLMALAGENLGKPLQ